MNTTCPECAVEFLIGEDIEQFNDVYYHPFCAAVLKTHTDLIRAEGFRKQKLSDENPWLWEFQQKYDEWVEKTFNREPDFETKYFEI